MIKKYYEHKIENLININKIITIHYFEFDKNFESEKEYHDFWEMVYCIKNNVICNIDGNNVKLNQGQLIFHKPNQPHSLLADKHNPTDVFIISFSTSSEAIHFFENKVITLDKGFEKYIFTIIEESKNTFNIPISDPKIKKMELKSNRLLGGLQIIKNTYEIFLIELMRKETKNDSDSVFLIRENYKGNLSGEIIKFLNENIYNDISISDLSSHFHYNKSYLFSKFKSDTGRSIMEFYTLLKIEQAKQLLLNTTKSIKSISDELCFDNPSYFSKVFKEHVKITPLKFRKK